MSFQQRLSGLVLNADFRPLSYYPCRWSWQDAIKAVFLERVELVEEYDQGVRSPSMERSCRAWVSLKSYVKPRPIRLSRVHVILRDRFSCQYCARATT